MKVSELIERLSQRPQDQEVILFLGGTESTEVPVQGVGSVDPKNGQPEKTCVVGFA